MPGKSKLPLWAGGRCQSNGESSVRDIACPDPSGYHAMSAPLAERGGAALLVDFAGDEMTFLVEMVVDLSMN